MATTKEKLKMALISGASKALKMKMENPHAPDDEILQQVNRESSNMVDKIDSEE